MTVNSLENERELWGNPIDERFYRVRVNGISQINSVINNLAAMCYDQFIEDLEAARASSSLKYKIGYPLKQLFIYPLDIATQIIGRAVLVVGRCFIAIVNTFALIGNKENKEKRCGVSWMLFGCSVIRLSIPPIQVVLNTLGSLLALTFSRRAGYYLIDIALFFDKIGERIEYKINGDNELSNLLLPGQWWKIGINREKERQGLEETL